MSDQAYIANGDDQHPLLVHFRQELRRLRQEHGWTQAGLAIRLEGWTEDTVSHVEVGRRDPTPKFAAACDRVFQTGETFQRLVKKAGVREDEDGISNWIDVERLAVTLRTWEPIFMPGLLQTGEYARAISEVWQAVDGDFDPDRYAAERLKRQEIFDRQPPPSFGAIIDESVLYKPVGGPRVMRGQLKHLLEMSQRPRVSVQILPTDTGAHVGGLGAFVMAMLPDSTTGMVYQETSTGEGRITANADVYARVSRIFDALRTDALNARASRMKIENILEERWPE